MISIRFSEIGADTSVVSLTSCRSSCYPWATWSCISLALKSMKVVQINPSPLADDKIREMLRVLLGDVAAQCAWVVAGRALDVVFAGFVDAPLALLLAAFNEKSALGEPLVVVSFTRARHCCLRVGKESLLWEV